MFTNFETYSEIHPEEFCILQAYFEHPEEYSDIESSNYWFADNKLGLRITAPIDGLRYFILPCDDEYEDEASIHIPITSPLASDTFTHEAIFLNNSAFVLLTALYKKEKTQLMVNSTQEYMVLKECFHEYDLNQLNPSLFPFQSLVYIEDNYQVMRYAGCDLETFFHHHPKLSMTKKDAIVEGILSELLQLHAQNFIHTDIKAANFCISAPDLKVCLIDYDEIKPVDDLNFNQNSMGTLTFLGPEFFQAHLTQFTKDAKSLRQFQACMYIALTEIEKNLYPYFFQATKQVPSFKSMSFFEIKKSPRVFLSLSNTRLQKPKKIHPFELEQRLMVEDWKALFSKESDLYALGCLLKFELKLEEASKFYPLMQQMLHPEPKMRTLSPSR